MSEYHVHFTQDATDDQGHRIALRSEDVPGHFRVSTADDVSEREAISAVPSGPIYEWADLIFADDLTPTGWQARIPLDFGIGHALVRRVASVRSSDATTRIDQSHFPHD